MAAVNVVFPWSTWPMVPMFTWGLFRTYVLRNCALNPETALAVESKWSSKQGQKSFRISLHLVDSLLPRRYITHLQWSSQSLFEPGCNLLSTAFLYVKGTSHKRPSYWRWSHKRTRDFARIGLCKNKMCGSFFPLSVCGWEWEKKGTIRCRALSDSPLAPLPFYYRTLHYYYITHKITMKRLILQLNNTVIYDPNKGKRSDKK